MQELQLTLIEKDKQMKDIYKREEKYQRTTQKLKQQVDGLLKE